MFRYWHNSSKKKKILIGVFTTVLLLVAVTAVLAVYNNYFRHYTLIITGGERMSNRHQLARVLQDEATKEGLTLVIKNTSGSFNALNKVNNGELDLALVQGGSSDDYKNVFVLSDLVPEVMHLVVNKDINNMDDLVNKTINVGPEQGGTHLVAESILQYFNLRPGVNYMESNRSAEEIPTLSGALVADAVFILSSAPSAVVMELVDKQGYKILQIPNIDDIMRKYSWEKKGIIPAAEYSSRPPIPPADIATVGIDLQLVANRKIDEHALARLKKVLKNSQMQKRLKEVAEGE